MVLGFLQLLFKCVRECQYVCFTFNCFERKKRNKQTVKDNKPRNVVNRHDCAFFLTR